MSQYNRNEIYELDEEGFAEWIEKNIVESMSKSQICGYFRNIYYLIKKLNNDLYFNSIASSTGHISNNPNLHGFLFEKLHVYTFNVKAILAHKNFRAYILPIDGGGFGKNSVDISIRTIGSNKVLKNYQAKCCKDVLATINAILNGDYHNQRLLICNNQVDDVKKSFSSARTVADCIEYDGIRSTPQNYSDVKAIQNALQSGDFSSLDLNMFSNKELILMSLQGLGKVVVVDAILRGIITCIRQGLSLSNKTLADDLKNQAKELSWDALRAGITQGIVLSIGKNVNIIPSVIKEIPSDILNPAIYETVGIITDTIRAGLDYSNGKIEEVEAYEKIIRSVIVSACSISGGAIAGVITDGGMAIPGSIAGKLIGEVIVQHIGDENLEKAANGCIEIKNKIKGFAHQISEDIATIYEKNTNVLMEG